MNRPTFAQLRSSSFPRALGLCATDFSDIRDGANECIERLMIDPMAPDEGWVGGWGKFAFNVQPLNPPGGHAYITTPRDVARLIGIDICARPIKLRNGFFEFLEFGRGLQPRSSVCGNGLFAGQNCACQTQSESFDRDNVPTLADLAATPQFIRIFPSNSGDVRKRVLIQGKDQNDKVVYGVDPLTGQAIEGEYVNLTQPFAQTVNQYSILTGLSKEPTLAPVIFQQVDASTGTAAALSSMEPSETTASYRRYLLTGLPRNCCNTPAGTVTVTAQAKLDFLPVITDSDYLSIPNIPALIEEAYCLRYSRMDSQVSSALEQRHHAKALTLLNGQLDHIEGKINVAITVPIFGSDRARLNPR